MGYPKDGRRGFDALKYRNTVLCREIDHRAVPRGKTRLAPKTDAYICQQNG